MGVDAGATRIRVAIADLSGRVVGRGEGGAGNALSVSVPELASHLRDAIVGAAPSGDLRARIGRVVAGFAGAVSLAVDPDDVGRERAHAALAQACGGTTATLEVRSDVEVAFASGAGTTRNGLVLVCGSGAAGGRLVDGNLMWTADGHGRLIDDAGSGFWIGRSAMRAALRALDGRGPWTTLVAGVCRQLGIERATEAEGPERVALRRALIRGVASRDEFYLSTLCPLVTRAAAGGDAVANQILDDAVAELRTTLTALSPRRGEPLVTTGGLLGPEGPLLGRFTAAVSELGLTLRPVEDGVAGAIVLALA